MIRILYAFLLFVTPLLSFAHNIKGIIKDTKGNPIVGANIYNTNIEQHSHSNELGQFVLKNAHTGDKIIVSYLGYKSIQYVIKAEDVDEGLVFTMQDEIFDLDQVKITN